MRCGVRGQVDEKLARWMNERRAKHQATPHDTILYHAYDTVK